ncbi:hypothetical protein QFC21_000644 [Naganishia friedmannii]|uniref:Uncharacterized protein n=1 Tax=Naganishia friedmannii TaxID=89922 RepID=A0ACC2WC39_9TREE|nr:hypothetical protein QFC21_000644 [Naganishia friedmannii]
MSPDRSAEAIDLTLDLTSDSDDDLRPICLSSSPATPLRSASIEVIGAIFSSGRLSQAQSRSSQHKSQTPPAEASSSESVQKDPHDTFSNVLARTPVEHVYKELNIGAISPTRPRPRRRKRPIIVDEEVVLPIPFDKGFQQPFSPLSPEPHTPNPAAEFGKEDVSHGRICSPIQMEYEEIPMAYEETEYEEDTVHTEYEEDTLVLSRPTTPKQVDGDSEWEYGGEPEETNGEASIYLPSHQASSALQADSGDVPSEAFSRLMSRMEQPVPGAVKWQELDELLHDNSGLSISLPLGEEAMQLDGIPDVNVPRANGSRHDSVSDEAHSSIVQETVTAALETRSRAQSSSRAYSSGASRLDERSVSPPIASRIGLRNRRKSVEMAKASSDQHALSRPPSLPTTPMTTENRGSVLRASVSSATSSSFSILTSGPNHPFERPCGRRRGGVSARVRAALFEDESGDLFSTRRESRIKQNIRSREEQHVEQELPRLEEEGPSARERTLSSGSEKDWCILPDLTTPTQPTSCTRSQESTIESPEISPGNRDRRDSATTANVESPNSVRRGTRVRKASDKKEYVPLSHIIRKSCRKSLAESAASTDHPTTPNAEAGPSGSRTSSFCHSSPIAVKSPSHAIRSPAVKSLLRMTSSLAVKSPLLASSSRGVQSPLSARSSLAVKSPSLAKSSLVVKSPSHVKSPASNTSFRLLPISPPTRRREVPQASGSESISSLSNTRSLGQNNTSLPETPTPAVSIATSPRIRPKVPAVPKSSQVVPFPPKTTHAEPNEYLIASDLQDTLLMAVCAVLHKEGNKAMGVADIAEAYVKYNWLQDESTMTPTVVYNAIRNYQRRVANASCLGRKSLLAKHILQGSLTEAYLTLGIHPDVVARATSTPSGPKGALWYLEGQYGSSRWESPFAKLKQNAEQAQAPLPIARQPKQRAQKAPKAFHRDTSTIAMPEAAIISRPRLRHECNHSVSKNGKAASTSDQEASASSRKIATSLEADGDKEEDGLSEDDSSIADNHGGDESAFAFYSNFDYFSESEDDSAFQTETDSEFGTVGELSDTSRKHSPTLSYASAIAVPDMSKPGDDGKAVLHVVGPAGPDVAIFPDNPLGPVRWERGTRASSYTFPFDTTSASDASHPSDDNDVLMEDVGSEDAESLPSEVPFCFQDMSDYRLLWNEEQAWLAEVPDLVDEDCDATAVTPVSSADSALLADLPYQREFSITSDREISAEPFIDPEEMADETLANVVQMLGQLLPPNDISSAIKDEAAFAEASYTTHRRIGLRAPRFFVNCGEPSGKPLGMPMSDIFSPHSSPCSTSIRAKSCGDTSVTTPPCDSRPLGTTNTIDDVLELEFLSSLRKQISHIGIGSEELSFFEDRSGIESPRNTWLLRNEKGIEVKQDDPPLGPESVGMRELDELLGESAGALPVASGSTLPGGKPFACDDHVPLTLTSFHSVLDAAAERQEVVRIVEQRGYVHSPTDTLRICSRGRDHATVIQKMVVDEDERIGIKEVDDAILYAWAEEGCQLTSKEMEDTATSTELSSEFTVTTRGSSMEMEFDIKSMSLDDPFEDEPMSVDPNVLFIARPPNLFSASISPEGPLLRPSSTRSLPTAWNDDPEMPQGSKAVPRFAIRPRAMVKCVPFIAQRSACSSSTASTSRNSRVKSVKATSEIRTRSSVSLASPDIHRAQTGTTPNGKVAVAAEEASAGAALPAEHRRTSPDVGGVKRLPSTIDHDMLEASSTINNGPCPPTVTTEIIDSVFMFVISWRNTSVYRRIDSNYINVSSLCRALSLADKESEFRNLPKMTEVRENPHLQANGVWAHMSLVATKFKSLPIPDELAAVLLNPDLIQTFPAYAKAFAPLSIKRALPPFGLAFGWKSSPGSASVSGQERPRHESPVVGAVTAAPSQPGTSTNQSSVHSRISVDQAPLVPQQSATAPLKRPSPTATSDQAASEEPLTKRLRPGN